MIGEQFDHGDEICGAVANWKGFLDYKEELLNAAVCHVDALEAELIATKKALYEALIRQEELMAYIDRQEEAKLWGLWFV
ncbi:hypothetical protein K1719_022124 [Acacia pycnantha]|nr:hypothetical protein K1719_022124 [Acacia pycnantha]